MSVEKDFVPYEEALILKGLGFDEPCLAYWNIDPQLKNPTFNMVKPFEHEWCLPAPTFSQAFRWFDENTELMGFVVPSIKEGHFDWLIRIDWEEEIECDEAYSSRIEAELECLRKLIEIVNERNLSK